MKTYEGIRARGKSIQINLSLDRREQITWPYDPSAANLAAASNKREEALLAYQNFKAGLRASFDLSEFFPQHAKKNRAAPEREDSLSDAMRRWAAKVGPDRSPSQREQYERFIEWFEERWPGMTVANFKFEHIQGWITELKNKGNTIKTITNRLAVIRGTCKMLMKEKRIKENPAAAIDTEEDLRPSHNEIVRRAARADIMDSYSPAELDKLFKPLSGQMRNMVLLYLEGPRTGEIFAADWTKVDWENRRIQIYSTTSRMRLGPRKNGRKIVNYWVLLSDHAMDALKDQKQYTYMLEPVKTGTEFGDVRFIFRNPNTGRPWSYANEFQKFWKDLSHRAGVRYRKPYNLRHTCASHLRSLGADYEWIARNKLGDSEKTVREYYAKYMPEVVKHAGMPDERLLLNKVSWAAA